eukprot:CAMPEP_0117455988 /NCGR_PEP_ID=MMETSP0759-20121206/11645_1 /TAXON_ID=63605 /ORGANISM="Percolomonas cosmopolitus, Strain WS" /LENGTH=251 /DNA_ID=CAMNT_0005249313 /DNA_START=199 /DNA_END=954 /DNA_ORIENTATION=+
MPASRLFTHLSLHNSSSLHCAKVSSRVACLSSSRSAPLLSKNCIYTLAPHTLQRSYASGNTFFLSKEQYDYFKKQGIDIEAVEEDGIKTEQEVAQLQAESDYDFYYAGIPKETPLDELDGRIPEDPTFEHNFMNPKYDKSLHLYARVDLSRSAMLGLYRRLLRAASRFPTVVQRRQCEFDIKNDFRKHRDLKHRDELITMVVVALGHEEDMQVLAKQRSRFFADDREEFEEKAPRGELLEEYSNLETENWK